MVRRTWMAIPALTAGALLMLLAGAQDTRGAQTSLDELAQMDGLTQAEMAVELLHALDGAELEPSDCVPGQEMFDDVPASNPFCPFIEELARRGITTGCGSDNFCPSDTVTRAQMATFVIRAQDGADGCRPRVPGTGEMVEVGGVCIDRYEASVWTEPDGGMQLTIEAEIDALCPDNGQDCKDMIFARSVPGVEPARDITWFQAQQALANSGKRLPTNAEWQMAASGTPDDTVGGPDPPICNTRSASVRDTGANAGCISDWGVNDMVGNVWEWAAEWIQRRSCKEGWWPAGHGNDFQGICGANESGAPAALIRGGAFGGIFGDGPHAGPFAVDAFDWPSNSNSNIGFRGVR